MAFSDSLRIVEPSAPGMLDREAEALDDEEQRLEARLGELQRLESERDAFANLKREQEDLAAAERELAAAQADTTATGEEIRERLVQGQARMAERARDVADAEIEYIEQRLEAIEAQRRVIRLTEQLERSAGARMSGDSAAAVEARAAARHGVERDLMNAWVTYADRQQEATDRLRDWAYARRALIEERSALMGSGSS
jgi:chromosome segregation ATPase